MSAVAPVPACKLLSEAVVPEQLGAVGKRLFSQHTIKHYWIWCCIMCMFLPVFPRGLLPFTATALLSCPN